MKDMLASLPSFTETRDKVRGFLAYRISCADALI